MQTKVLIPDAGAYQLASDLLNRGELVAFPTETVYGLGANALNREAVLSIFSAKGRPADNPLIVHIHDRSQLDDLCTVPPLAGRLMDAFWPGPLTMLFVRKPAVPLEVTAGLPTVAIRMPSHPVAAAMLKACGLPEFRRVLFRSQPSGCRAVRKQFRASQSDHSCACPGRHERKDPPDPGWRRMRRRPGIHRTGYLP